MIGYISLLILIQLMPVLFWMGVYLSRDKGAKEPRRLILGTFACGMIMTIPLIIWRFAEQVHWIAHLPLFFGVFGIFFWAYMEEMLKHAGALQIMQRFSEAHNEVTDGILYAVCAALGFSFAENLVYSIIQLMQHASQKEIVSVLMGRTVLSMFAHTVFSSVFGYAYAKAYISPDTRIITRSSMKRSFWVMFSKMRMRAYTFPIMRQALRTYFGKQHETWEGANAMSLVAEGAIVAALAHGVYNVLLTSTYSFLVFPYLFVWGCVVFWLLKKKK